MLNFIEYLGAVLNLDLSAFFATYWALVILVVGFVVYLIVARAKAKQLILGLMLQVEKNAEDYLLANGDQMFSYVVSRAYPLLPPILRLLLSYDAFKLLAQKLYDEAKDHLSRGNQLNPPNSPVPPQVVDQTIVQPPLQPQVLNISPEAVVVPTGESETTATTESVNNAL
jgi:hypothetical protein